MQNQTPEEGFDLADAFEQMLAYQRELEEKARNIVEVVRKMLDDMREDLVAGFNAPFARLHGAWYDGIERQLVAEGFTPLGPYRDATPRGEKPPEVQSFYRFARSSDGTIVASWFWLPVEKPHGCVVLHSWAKGGAVAITGSGIADTGLPVPPDQRVLRLDASTALSQLLSAHREQVARLPAPLEAPAGMDEIIALRDRVFETTDAYRRQLGVGLFEPFLRKVWGDQYEDEGAPFVEVINEHPEWWTGEQPVEDDDETANGDEEPIDPNVPPVFMFLMSRDDENGGRGHITTLGLGLRGLPEMQMKELSANHCRAARFLMGAVAKRLVKHVAALPPSNDPIDARLSGIELTVHAEDPWINGSKPPKGPPPGEAVTVALRMEEFGGQEASAELLCVLPPRDWTRSADEWLVDVCHRLGRIEIPAAAPLSTYDATMSAASERARKSIPELRHRLQSGLPAGHAIAIKTGLLTPSGGKEFVWVKVSGWANGAFVGTLAVEPSELPNLTMGQEMRVADADVFDRAIYSETEGPIELPLTDTVAQDFGVDLTGQ